MMHEARQDAVLWPLRPKRQAQPYIRETSSQFHVFQSRSWWWGLTEELGFVLSAATTLEVQVSNVDNKYGMQKVGILTLCSWFKLAFLLVNFNALAHMHRKHK